MVCFLFLTRVAYHYKKGKNEIGHLFHFIRSLFILNFLQNFLQTNSKELDFSIIQFNKGHNRNNIKRESEAIGGSKKAISNSVFCFDNKKAELFLKKNISNIKKSPH